MTAKDTQFGRKTFTSWLIESVGTLPIKRRSEHGDSADNTVVMEKLVKVCKIYTDLPSLTDVMGRPLVLATVFACSRKG
jgi:hypothetical protein